jgi:hypothetical protein
MTARKAIGLYVVGQVSRERLSGGFLIARRFLGDRLTTSVAWPRSAAGGYGLVLAETPPSML